MSTVPTSRPSAISGTLRKEAEAGNSQGLPERDKPSPSRGDALGSPDTDLTGLPGSVQEGCMEGVMDRFLLAQKVLQATKLTPKCKHLEARNGSCGAEMEEPGMVSTPSSSLGSRV